MLSGHEAVVALGGMILAHALASVWWASKVTTTLDFMAKTVDGAVRDWKTGKDGLYEHIDKELERRDSEIKTLWKRVDEQRNDITQLKEQVKK